MRGAGLMMRIIARMLVLSLSLLALSGCSAYMAANQPAKKDLNVLKIGSPRAAVIAELGAPVYTSTKNGAHVDIFNFVNGYSGFVRGGRAVLHGVADVATLGLWEVVGTPIEGANKGTKMSVEVTYDASDRIAAIAPLRGQDEMHEEMTDETAAK